jgi:hypothetical protein
VQQLGCCTGVHQCVKANTRGNRVRGQILRLADAVRIYSRATQLDPWSGEYPPTDTGSSRLAAAKASMEAGLIERHEWVFAGVDQVLGALAQSSGSVGHGGAAGDDDLPVTVGEDRLRGLEAEASGAARDQCRAPGTHARPPLPASAQATLLCIALITKLHRKSSACRVHSSDQSLDR